MKIYRTSAILTFFTLLFFPLLAFAHVHLEKSQPSKGETLSTAPTAVQLWFSGNVEAEWSKIEVTDASGQRVDQEKVTSADNDPKSIKVDLKPLAAGQYEVKWNAIASDGHRIKGSMSFQVK